MSRPLVEGIPIATVDRHTALVVIDLQQATIANPMAHPVGEVVTRAAALAAAFRRQRLPVVLVNAAGTPPGRSDRGGGEAARWPGRQARLVPELDALAGVATSFGAESTARAAYDVGFHVVLAVAVGATIGASA